MRITFDTNILVYAADSGAGTKHEVAGDLITRATNVDSMLVLQCLAEFFFVATRKAKAEPTVVKEFVTDWREVFAIRGADEETFVRAMDAVVLHGIAFWDAMMWAVARQAQCDFLISEDFQDGRQLEGVTFLTDIPQIVSWFAEIIAPCHRRGNEIIFAAA
ncbi:MAG: PIN domain-containing protein [Alphaproteobacteria bacterium]|nr:PIN domain-containing protein [Alphaproteobacteria bacterium]